MEIRNIVILGTGLLREKIKHLFSHTDMEVTVSDYNFHNADMVIEVSSGPIEGKKEVFHMADRQAKKETIFATTSPFGITQIASLTKRPSRFVGLNFVFNPFDEKSLVQIVKALETSDETIEACKALLSKTGAITIEIKDLPGLIVDRVMASVINEGATMCAAGITSVEDIDKVARSCLNWPAGPFELADILGIDEVLAILEFLYQEEGPQFLPCRLLKQMVAMGRLGRKTGSGFYTYSWKGER